MKSGEVWLCVEAKMKLSAFELDSAAQRPARSKKPQPLHMSDVLAEPVDGVEDRQHDRVLSRHSSRPSGPTGRTRRPTS